MKGFRWRRSLLVDNPEDMIVNENYPAVAAIFDGSGDAAGASLYCITRGKSDRQNTVRLIMSKTKISNLAGATVPKAELVSCYLSCLILAWIKANCPIKFNRTFLIGDSTSVLSQVKNKSILFKPFEQSRLRVITHLTKQSDFFHVKSQHNQSDILTRLNLNLTKEDLEKWVSGTFLTEDMDNWPITGIDEINPTKDSKIPGLNPKYENFPLNSIILDEDDTLNKIEVEDIENCLENINAIDETNQLYDDDSVLLINSMLNKQKKSQNAFYADLRQKKNNTRSDGPTFLKSQKELEAELETETEIFTDLLRKHRNLNWSIRIVAYLLKFKYKEKTLPELFEQATTLLQKQASVKTKHYILKTLSGSHQLIFEDAEGIPRLENRGWIGDQQVPEDSIIVSPKTELGKAVLRFYHDKYHNKNVKGIKAQIRMDPPNHYYIPRSTKFLQKESKNCAACIIYR